MSKSFKLDPDTFEETTRVKRHGNVRKLKAIEKRKERRKRRKERGVQYDEIFKSDLE